MTTPALFTTMDREAQEAASAMRQRMAPLPTADDLEAAMSALFAIEQKLPMDSDERRAFYRVRVQFAQAWDHYARPLIEAANRPAPEPERAEEVSS